LYHTCIKTKNATQKILESFAFIITAGIFENEGVFSKDYVCDLHKLMMIGNVPFEVLIIEASIFYVAFVLADDLNVTTWSKPIIIGFFSSVQDMTLDPSAIYDMHSFDGKMSGQSISSIRPMRRLRLTGSRKRERESAKISPSRPGCLPSSRSVS
jgi:hypothetical protein